MHLSHSSCVRVRVLFSSLKEDFICFAFEEEGVLYTYFDAISRLRESCRFGPMGFCIMRYYSFGALWAHLGFPIFGELIWVTIS